MKESLQNLIDQMVADSEFMNHVLRNPDILKVYELLPEISNLLLKLNEMDFEKARNGNKFIEGMRNLK